MTAPSPEQPEGPPFAPSAIPTDPAEQEAWKQRFTEDLADGPLARWLGVPWDDRDGRA